MKIANIVRRFVFSEWGGIEASVWNSSKLLKTYGNVPEIICTKALCPTSKELVDGISIHRFNYRYPQLFLNSENAHILDKKGGNPFSLDMYRYMMKNPFDIVHIHTGGRLAKQAVLAARKKGIPSVVSFHGGHYDVPRSELDEMKRPLKGTLGYGRFVEKFFGMDFDLVEAADGIICIGQNEYDEIRKRFPNKKTALIPNGVFCEKFETTPSSSFKKEFSIPAERKLIVCISRIDYQKNQRALVRLVNNLTKSGEDVHCAIVGFATSKSYLDALKADISFFKLENRFTIVEGLPPDSDLLISAYKSADVFAFPSVHEPFGIVALEAWSAGVPLVASKVGGLKTLVENGVTGFLFDPSSDSEFLNAYHNAILLGFKTKQNALKLVKEKYSWQIVAKSIEDFYIQLKNDFR